MDPFRVICARPRDDLRGGVDPFLLNAPPYYAVYKQDSGVERIDGAVVNLKSDSMLELLEAVAGLGRKNVLLVSHGDSDGLPFTVGTKSSYSFAPWISWVLLMHLPAIKRAYANALKDPKKADDPSNWYEAYALTHPDYELNFSSGIAPMNEVIDGLRGPVRSQALAEFKAGVEGIGEGFSEEEKKDKSNQAQIKSQQKQTVARVRTAVRDQVKKIHDQLGVDEKEADRLLAALAKVHQLGLERVELRACTLGESPEVMTLLCLFLGARELRAPDVFTGFGAFVADVQPEAAGFSKRTVVCDGAVSPSATGVAPADRGGRAEKTQQGWPYTDCTLPDNGNELFYDITKDGEPSLVAESLSVVHSFIANKFGPIQGGVNQIRAGSSFPAQYMDPPNHETGGPPFTMDARFAKHLIHVQPDFKVDLQHRTVAGL